MIEENNYMPHLPKGWVWTRLGEVAEINPKLPMSLIPDDLELSFLPMKAVEERTGKYDLSLTRKYSEVKRGFTPFMDGDIIFAKITPCMENGKVAIVNNLKSGMGFGSTEFHVIRLIGRDFSKEYVFYFLLQEDFRKIARRNMKGTAGQLRVPPKFMEEASIPLPPAPEQRRIVSRVEELFSVLDAGVESLRKVKAQLKRYRQAVLKYAFEGKLTEEWRKTHKDQIGLEHELKPVGPDILGSFQLPPEWVWVKIRELGELISGQHILKENYNSTGVGMPYLTGPADFGDTNPIISRWTTKPKVIAKSGDVLITVKGAGVGKVNILNIEKVAISRQLMAIRSKWLSPSLIFYYLRFTFNQIQRLGSGSTVPGIRREELLELPVPLCSPLEQDRIIHQVERNMVVAYEIEKAVEHGLVRAERLRQSILKNAFEGKLVPQDAADEPAQKLLERIKEEKARRVTGFKTNKKNHQERVGLIRYVE